MSGRARCENDALIHRERTSPRNLVIYSSLIFEEMISKIISLIWEVVYYRASSCPSEPLNPCCLAREGVSHAGNDFDC